MHLQSFILLYLILMVARPVSLTHFRPILYCIVATFQFHILIQCDRFDGNEFGGQNNLPSSQLPLFYTQKSPKSN